MRMPTRRRGAAAGFIVLVTLLSSGAVSAAPSRSVFFPLQRIPALPFGQLRAARARTYVTPTYCTTAAVPSFEGMGNAGDVSGGKYSGVAAGSGNDACDEYSGIGAGSDNAVGGTAGLYEASFIAGGEYNAIVGAQDFIGAGYGNEATDYDAFVGAGVFNTAQAGGAFVGSGGIEYFNASSPAELGAGNVASATDSFVGAGDLNQIAATGTGSFIGAGGFAYAASGSGKPGNQISGVDSFVGAGDQNTVAGNESFLGGGDQNVVDATSAFLGGGYANVIGASAAFSAIDGGNANSATNTYEAVGGGYDNAAKGADAMIPGGQRNEAYGELSFAAGYQAHALYPGSFVWSDYKSGSAPLADTAADQFVVRASGGTTVYSNEADTSGVKLAAGSGAWSNLSDRNAKTGIVPVDDASILAKLSTLPIDAWQYKTERGVRHLGPMAQDFYAAFGAGEDDRHITSIDEDGVALAAIKALHRENAGLRSELRRLEGVVAELRH